MKDYFLGHKLTKILSTGLCFSLGLFPLWGDNLPVYGAERVVFSLSVLGDFSVSVDSLEAFAKEGKINRDFALYANNLDAKTLENLRQVLNQRFDADPVMVSRLLRRGIGEALLKRMGQLVQMEGNVNGFYGLRSALVLAALDESEGLTLINVMRYFPRQDIRINTDLLFDLAQEFATLFEYGDATVEAIAQQGKLEAANEEEINQEILPDLVETGDIEVIKTSRKFEINKIRQTPLGLSPSYSLNVDFYLPKNLEKPAPLVIISHGFGSYPDNYQIAQHLASYGFAVAIPQHLGSDLAYRESFLEGNIRIDISPFEYISRPSDIRELLDEIETLVKTDSQWSQQIDLERIGVLGHSLGGVTALSLAGATINLPRLKEICQDTNLILNPAGLLQCRADYLPPGNYNFKDPRIKTVIALHPLSSVIFGPEGMGKIDIPILMVAGSKDLVSPTIQEQIHPFVWIKSPQKYLSLLVPGTHFSTILQPDTQGVETLPEFLLGNNADLGRPYFNSLAVAFFKLHLTEDDQYSSYLTSSYHQEISQERLKVHLIKNLTPQQLQASYDGKPPTPIIPKTVVASQQESQETILEEIKRTGIIKVGLRLDTPPFGYLDEQGNYTGYCGDFIREFSQYLQNKYNVQLSVDVITIPSTEQTRFNLVKDNIVHLECGPNTIDNNIDGVSFSNIFFISGTQFFVKKDNPINIRSSGQLEGKKIGVLRNTTTERFIQEKYKQTEIIYFEGNNASREGIEKVINDQIDLFADDGILLLGKMKQENLSLDNYKIIPNRPLTCEFYGMILPENDQEWLGIVNEFIGSKNTKPIWDKWFKELVPYVLLDLDYCVNNTN
ncbi:alpha/beta hydrolase [Crocosphaera sp.]|uniref:alpha/beta hydrolase n=1 Tax=Crocosphaera sp. TaxID=2729996 RepID=UPI00261C7FAA|nr:alpha/beta hydrolase [Crocosphaera sp.]MDJ0578768.1 alpha/beta hydrolase [Crocosphaera sp.]